MSASGACTAHGDPHSTLSTSTSVASGKQHAVPIRLCVHVCRGRLDIVRSPSCPGQAIMTGGQCQYRRTVHLVCAWQDAHRHSFLQGCKTTRMCMHIHINQRHQGMHGTDACLLAEQTRESLKDCPGLPACCNSAAQSAACGMERARCVCTHADIDV